MEEYVYTPSEFPCAVCGVKTIMKHSHPKKEKEKEPEKLSDTINLIME